MRKIMRFMFLIGLLRICIACEVKNDYVFDDISTHRITKYIDECNDVMQKAPNGWKLVYYPDTSQYGGFTFLLKFKDGQRVDMAWDGGEETTNSSYSFNTSQGPILSFDTYSLLHCLADPAPEVMGGKPGLGFGGEYEFLIQDVVDNKIEFLTKKRKNKVVMEWATVEDWENMDASREMVKRFEVDRTVPFYHYLEIAGEKACFLYSQKLRMVYMVYPKGGTMVAEKFPWTSTVRGIRFDHPVTFAGVTFSEVKIDENKVMSIVDATEKGRFFRAANSTDLCLVRLPGSVLASQKYDGFNLLEYGTGLNVLYPSAKPIEDFRFYWNLSGFAGFQVYLRAETGIASYASLYPSRIQDDGIGDQVVFEKPSFPRSDYSGEVNIVDQTWFAAYVSSVVEKMFMEPATLTVLAFGKQTFMIRNGNNLAWGLYSAKEGRN